MPETYERDPFEVTAEDAERSMRTFARKVMPVAREMG